MNYHAVGKNIVVRVMRKPEEGAKKGVLILNTTKAWDHTQYSEVLCVGEEVKINAHPGDTVITRGNAGIPIGPSEQDENLTVRVVDESEILARVEE